MTDKVLVSEFLRILGYDDSSDAKEDKNSKKIYYALKFDEKVEIVIEIKGLSEKIAKKDSELKKHFEENNAKIGILTNGIKYKFYSNLDELKKMDNNYFLN